MQPPERFKEWLFHTRVHVCLVTHISCALMQLLPVWLHVWFPPSSAVTVTSRRLHRTGSICSKKNKHVTMLALRSQGSIIDPDTINIVIRPMALGLTGRGDWSWSVGGQELEPKASPVALVHLQMSAQTAGGGRLGRAG